MFLDSRPIGDLLKGTVEHMWSAAMMFGKYIEFCEDNSQPPGCEPLLDMAVVAARPADPFDTSNSMLAGDGDD
jgi:hypothetical protein